MISVRQRAWASATTFLLLCSTAAPAVPALQDNPLHFCTLQDLKGVYVLVNFREAPMGRESIWKKQFPYQYIEFYSDKRFATIAVAHEIRAPATLNGYLDTEHRSGKQKFMVSGAGQLMLQKNTNKERYQCVGVNFDNGGYKKGDLIFTGINDKDKSELYKLYRHWY